MEEIGIRFLEIRKNLSLTQKEFAERLDVSFGSVQAYEYGKTPKGDVLQKLYDWGYDLNWLFSGKGEMKRGVGFQHMELDRMLMWNVAYFLCKRSEMEEDPIVFADTYMEVYDCMNKTNEENAISRETTNEDMIANVVDFTSRRLKTK